MIRSVHIGSVLRIGALSGIGLFIFTAILSGADGQDQSHEDALAQQILEDTKVKGGFIVHLGCSDGKLTAALRARDSYLVHGLATTSASVDRARRYVQSRGLYGPVSIDRLGDNQLPYIDNLVNLVVADDLGDVPMEEVIRVLCPSGVGYIKQGESWQKTIKPRPDAIDEWTHYLHDATNNAVAHDTVIGPPRHFQWMGSPRYSRHHDHMSAASAMVSTGGRLFYIFDHGSPMSIQLPSQWQLVARDAFNGTVLWRRAIEQWHPQLFRLKSGPAQLTRRLVAVDDRVYVTLGIEAPVTALDAATGQTIHTYSGTEKTEEIIFSDGILFLLVNDAPARQPDEPRNYNYNYADGPRRVLAVDASTGNMMWDQTNANVLPVTLTADTKHVLYCDGESVVCLDRQNGKKLWSSDPLMRRRVIPTFFAPTLVAYQDVVLFSGGSHQPDERNRGGGQNIMYALSIDSGQTLWTADHPGSGYKSPEDILVVDDLVWTTATTVGGDSGEMTGRDPRTGEVRKQFLPDVDTHWFHHRCYRAKATDNFIITSRTGIEFVDHEKEHWICNHWVRGACFYGVMPANGMVYNPPHPCACYLEAKLYGFNALAPTSPSRQVPRDVPREDRLQRGPAYADAAISQGEARTPRADEWPTYRHDPARSGFTTASIGAEVERAWEINIGGRLSSVVIGDGKVFVASIDTHTIHALDAKSGEKTWSYTTGGRVDSPPTIWNGRVLFGSADGYVYCLRATDGALAWRFRAAPLDLRMASFEQIESVWPVHGSVLIRDGELWCVAGRSMFLDGGLRLLRLDPATGRLIDERVLDDRDPASGENLQVRIKTLNMPVAMPDVLSYDGKYVYMRSQRFDDDGIRQQIEVPTLNVNAQRGEGPHLFSPSGFLDDVWWHRSYWLFGRVWKSGAGGYSQAGRVTPAGRPMVFNDTKIYGYGRKPRYYRWTTPMEYHLFATAKQPDIVNTATDRQRRRGLAGGPKTRVVFDWTDDIPVLVRAMVLADKTIFIAGPPDLVDEEQTLSFWNQAATQKQLARQAAAIAGSEGASLRAVSAVDGSLLAKHQLESVPVFDGMAATSDRLYMATTDGKVLCLAGG